MSKPEVRGGKSFGTAGRGKGVSADVEVPIVRTGKPAVAIVEPIRKSGTMSQVIPAEAVEAAAYALYVDANPDTEVQWFDITFHEQDELMWTATKALEAAAPHMPSGDGENRPGWDDRKTLASIWQGSASLPAEGLSDGVYEALIEVAAWGYQQRMDEEALATNPYRPTSAD